jgi:hypothetical protein
MVALPEISGGAALSLFESLPRHQWEISFIAHEGKVSFEYCRQYKPPLRLSLGRSRRFVCAPDPDITLSSRCSEIDTRSANESGMSTFLETRHP